MTAADAVGSIVLGILQGFTEFLPISSSGHLVVAGAWLGVSSPGGALEVALHGGTLAAVLVHYRRDVAWLARSLLPWRRGEEAERGRRLAGFLVAATLPAAAAGLLFGDRIEALFDRPRVAGFGFLATGALLLLAEARPTGSRRADRAGWLRSLAVGAAQAAALVPGVSRSGATIACALRLGLAPLEAARFSFLMAIPAILGAVVLEAASASDGLATLDPGAAGLGVAAAALSGLLAIRWLERLLAGKRLRPFALYVFLLGAAVLLWAPGAGEVTG